MPVTHHVRPAWDAIEGEYLVETATQKDMGDVRGETREAFNASVERSFAPDTHVTIHYDDYAAQFACSLN